MKRFVRSFSMVAVAGAALAAPLSAQLYWKSPDFRGAPVSGDEPTVVIPLPDANQAEKDANLAWTLRAGLNVAALQCEFAPSLLTRMNYNGALTHHAKELAADYKTLGAYFRRKAAKGTSASAVAIAFDQYTTRTYNSFSTLTAQIGFCQTAASIGEQALMTPKGDLSQLARLRLRELRNSLTPMGDPIYQQPSAQFASAVVPGFAPDCFDKKGNLKKRCMKD